MELKKIMVGMSGGVDSAAAAILLKKAGYEVAGCTMVLCDAFSDENLSDAKKCCEILGIPHFTLELKKLFKEQVMDNFVSEYENGRTPNPCINCNKNIKFGAMLDFAMEKGYDGIATGHYAEKTFDEKTGLYSLVRPKDRKKDQTYVLYNMTQNDLARTVFPLYGSSKPENRALTEEYGFVNSQKKDSQDICFIPDGDYVSFLENYTQKTYPAGDFIDKNGEKLGTHSGIVRYTVGQRKGLGVAFGKPLYVCEKNPQDNTVTLGDLEDIYVKTVVAEDINLVQGEKITGELKVFAKTRYNMTECSGVLTIDDENRMILKFDENIKGVAKGQSLVVYKDDCVVGGGVIVDAF